VNERYSVDLTLTPNGVHGTVWRRQADHPGGGSVSEQVSDFPNERTLTGALTVAGQIIRLDRDGRKKRSDPLTNRDCGDESDARRKGGT
jgi:hypothetical protein